MVEGGEVRWIAQAQSVQGHQANRKPPSRSQGAPQLMGWPAGRVKVPVRWESGADGQPWECGPQAKPELPL